MKRFLFMAILSCLGLVFVQCTKTDTERVEIKGERGERGNLILSGIGVPDASQGMIGDYYLDLSTANLYGAKTAKGWGTPISLKGLKGDAGTDGANGTNGQDGKDAPVPQIKNGFWYIGETNTHIKAQGEKGTDGTNGTNGRDGQNGLTPHIGYNGNWFIGNQDTHIKVQGDKGDKGETGATGAQGLPGKDGSKIYSGQGKPVSQGVEGDYYIDTEAKIFYGPKTNTGWPSTGISLTAQQMSDTDYELSTDGKILLKWKNEKTLFIDMNTDPKLKDVEIIADNAFNAEINKLTYQLRTFVIGNKVKDIGAKAFYLCTKLTSVEVSNENIRREITKIKTQTFANCTHLQNVDIPSSVTTIEARAFTGCNRLTSVILPETVNNIVNNAFAKCDNLHTVIIRNPNAFSIGTMAFNQTLLRNIYVPSGKVEEYKILNPQYKDFIK